jgi:hypothetical protein
MIVTTPRTGRFAATLTVAITALAISLAPAPWSHGALTARNAGAAICTGGGNCTRAV